MVDPLAPRYELKSSGHTYCDIDSTQESYTYPQNTYEAKEEATWSIGKLEAGDELRIFLVDPYAPPGEDSLFPNSLLAAITAFRKDHRFPLQFNNYRSVDGCPPNRPETVIRAEWTWEVDAQLGITGTGRAVEPGWPLPFSVTTVDKARFEVVKDPEPTTVNIALDAAGAAYGDLVYNGQVAKSFREIPYENVSDPTDRKLKFQAYRTYEVGDTPVEVIVNLESPDQPALNAQDTILVRRLQYFDAHFRRDETLQGGAGSISLQAYDPTLYLFRSFPEDTLMKAVLDPPGAALGGLLMQDDMLRGDTTKSDVLLFPFGARDELVYLTEGTSLETPQPITLTVSLADGSVPSDEAELTVLPTYFDLSPGSVEPGDTTYVTIMADDREAPDFDGNFYVEVYAQTPVGYVTSDASIDSYYSGTFSYVVVPYAVADTSYSIAEHGAVIGRVAFVAAPESEGTPVPAKAASSGLHRASPRARELATTGIANKVAEVPPEEVQAFFLNATHYDDWDKEGVRLVLRGEGPEIEILDDKLEKSDFVQIARWDRAYGPGPAYDVYNEADTSRNFIDRDPEHFYVRITDHSRNTNPEEEEIIIAKIGSAGVDVLTEVELEETDENTGIFESKTQLLTSVDFEITDEGQTSGGIAGHLRYTDDKFRVHDGASGIIEDEDKNDRTHQAQVGGAVTVAYEAASGRTFEQTVSVCHPDSVKRLDVEIIVFNEPYLDEGYVDPNTDELVGADNGEFDFYGKAPGVKHQPGVASERYRDLSVYEPVWHNFDGIWRLVDIPEPYAGDEGASEKGDGYGGVVSEERIQAELHRAQSAWAQACITIERVNVTEPVDVPISIRRRMQRLGKFTEGYAVYEAYKDEMGLDVFYVFFTPPMDFTLGGWTYLPSGAAGRDGDVSYAFISSGPVNISDDRILAHEIGHALSNRDDVENERYIFFPKHPRPFPDTNVVTERRLSKETINQCRMRRPPGAYEQAGNLLLKSQ